MPTTTELGERIKQRRLARNLTLKQVGDKAKVSATHLSEIERGKTSPTVGALMRIARALGEEPACLVAEDERPRLAVVRRDRRRAWTCGATTVHVLTRPIHAHEMTVLEVEFGADPLPGLAESGEVMVVVLAGTVDVVRAGERHALGEGDVMHFAAGAPHELRAGGAAARCLMVCSPPLAW